MGFMKEAIKKHFYYVFALTAEPVTISYENETWFIPVRKYKITDSFYRTFECKRCGRCCKEVKAIVIDSNVFNKDNKLLREGCIKDKIIINGKEYTFYRSKELHPYCQYLNTKTNLCKIYPDRPLLSRMPHLFFDTNKNTNIIYITQRQYGRNWALGCKAQEQSFLYDYYDAVLLPKLIYLKKCITRYQIPSQINDVIKEIQQSVKELYKKKYDENKGVY